MKRHEISNSMCVCVCVALSMIKVNDKRMLMKQFTSDHYYIFSHRKYKYITATLKP